MADADIPSDETSIKKTLSLIPTPLERFVAARGYDLTPALLPTADRVYADARTQEAYEIWTAGAQWVACMVTQSIIETEAMREKLLRLVGDR